MAKRFHFRLAPVLRYREMIEDEKKRDFALANRAVEEERMHLEEMDRDRIATQDAVREMYRAGGDFHRIVDAFRYMNGLEIAMGMSRRKIEGLQKIADQKRDVFVGARRDKRALEILKERQEEEAKAEMAREEQQQIDEQGIRLRQLGSRGTP